MKASKTHLASIVLMLAVFDIASGALVAHWSMDGQGATIEDSSGNGHSGVAIDTEYGADGICNGFRSFNENSYIIIGDSDEFNFTTAFTLMAWIRPGDDVTDHVIIAKENGDDTCYTFYLKDGNRIGLNSHFGYGHIWFEFLGESSVPVNQWRHVAATYDNEAVRFYINGIPDGVFSLSGVFPTHSTSVYLGQSPWVFLETLRGDLDEVQVWDSCLSPEDILLQLLDCPDSPEVTSSTWSMLKCIF